MVAITQGCPKLTNFCISLTEGVTDYGLVELAVRCAHLVDVTFSSTAVTDIGVIELAKRCPTLVVVNISSTTVTDASVAELVTRCPELQLLDLSECAHLTDASVDAVIHHGNLREVFVHGGDGFSAQAMSRLMLWKLRAQ